MLIRCRRCHFFLQQQQSIFINPPPDHSYCRYMKCTLPLHLTLSRTLECMKFAFNYIFCFCLSCHWVSPWLFQFCHLYPSCLADSVGPATEGQTDAPHRSQFAGKLIFVNVTVASSSTSGRWKSVKLLLRKKKKDGKERQRRFGASPPPNLSSFPFCLHW